MVFLILLRRADTFAPLQFYQTLPADKVTDKFLWGRLEPLLGYLADEEKKKVLEALHLAYDSHNGQVLSAHAFASQFLFPILALSTEHSGSSGHCSCGRVGKHSLRILWKSRASWQSLKWTMRA